MKILHYPGAPRKSLIYKGFLFDGFPRNLSQAKAFDILLGKSNQSITSVIQLSVHEEEISKRIQKRKLHLYLANHLMKQKMRGLIV